jgi:hypothetical protein
MVVGFIFDLTILPDAHISPHFARRSLTEAPSIQDVGPFMAWHNIREIPSLQALVSGSFFVH